MDNKKIAQAMDNKKIAQALVEAMNLIDGIVCAGKENRNRIDAALEKMGGIVNYVLQGGEADGCTGNGQQD